jgi:hypothetical protein
MADNDEYRDCGGIEQKTNVSAHPCHVAGVAP